MDTATDGSDPGLHWRVVSGLTAQGLPDGPVIPRTDVLWGGRQLAIQWRDGNTLYGLSPWPWPETDKVN